MHFNTKNYLKSTCNHTVSLLHGLSCASVAIPLWWVTLPVHLPKVNQGIYLNTNVHKWYTKEYTTPYYVFLAHHFYKTLFLSFKFTWTSENSFYINTNPLQITRSNCSRGKIPRNSLKFLCEFIKNWQLTLDHA
jgi:hypothetical protein